MMATLATLGATVGITQPFSSLDRLGEVLPSGDSYPNTMVAPSGHPYAFAGKQVLFAFSHGVEDHEVFYQHQYFTQRGANVTFGCPARSAPSAARCVISDFYKPSYTVEFVDLARVDLMQFDAVFVPGGLPSSSDLRRDPSFPMKLYRFWRTPAPSPKILAIICSGNEVVSSTK